MGFHRAFCWPICVDPLDIATASQGHVIPEMDYAQAAFSFENLRPRCPLLYRRSGSKTEVAPTTNDVRSHPNNGRDDDDDVATKLRCP